MKGQFHVDRGARSTTGESYAPQPAIEPDSPLRPWQFVGDFQHLVGKDSEPDALFFVESWTLGVAAAAENFQRRARRTPENRIFSESRELGTAAFVQEHELDSKIPSPMHSTGSAGSYGEEFWRQVAGETPERIHGPAACEWDSFSAECRRMQEGSEPMTQQRACRLLGVTAASSPDQVKAAYRRMASLWHPDRLQRGSEKERRLANEQMIAINEAYRLLRNGMAQDHD